MNKKNGSLKASLEIFIAGLKKAGYKLDYSEESLKYLELAIDGLKNSKNTDQAKHIAYVYLAIYLSQVFVSMLPNFKVELEFINDELDEVCITDKKSFIYLTSWIYAYGKNPKKESIVKKYRSTVKLIAPKKPLN